LRHSVPIGKQLSVTLQDSGSLTETYAPAPGATGGSSLPAATPAPTGPSRVWANERSAKLDVLPTGTSFGAAMSSASNDPVTHNTLSAEQKIAGGLHVRTAVSDIDKPTPNKSISAGFKLTW